MENKNTDKKEIIIAILILLGGAAFTTMSFCVYYLVKPQNVVGLTVICIVDFLYNNLCTCVLFKYMDKKKWLLKGFLLSIGYIVAFIAVAVVFIVFSTAIDFLKNNILGIVLYAFFTAPSIFLVMALVLLCLAYS